MPLSLKSFDNTLGTGDALFKALGHPIAAAAAPALLEALRRAGPIAVFDPDGAFATFAELYDLAGIDIAVRLVQRVEQLDGAASRWPAAPVPALGQTACRTLFVASFEPDIALRSCRPFLPVGMAVHSFAALRLPDRMLSNRRRYLDPINFATNVCLFRAGGGRRSVLRSHDYWSGYGAVEPALWLCLFDGDGRRLADWEQALEPGRPIALDAEDIRARFGLPPFYGSLFVHALRVAGHDLIKYVLDDRDTENRAPAITHDANSWPADFYAGLPAPGPGERILLWLQNSHPAPIPAGALALRRMGSSETRAIPAAVAPYGTVAVDVGALFPDLAWPDQLELIAGRHVVRPRYETLRSGGRVTLNHLNVERTDLRPDPAIAGLGRWFGKGFLLPAPVLPADRWETLLLPTPMATEQQRQALTLTVYDADGGQIVTRPLGMLARDHRTAVAVDSLLPSGFAGGHLELTYDFAAGTPADGWLHALFRYVRRDGGAVADTSFGAHVFNTAMVWRGEPQSYHGRPPGLSTRLFLRLAPTPAETVAVLIYPVSAAWLPRSDTKLSLFGSQGEAIAERQLAIPASGSRLVEVGRLFGPEAIAAAGPRGYVMVRDTTCRLFGYHGEVGPSGGFCLDHMFGF